MSWINLFVVLVPFTYSAIAVYLAWSFWSGKWDFTWILWPVAGVLFAAVNGIAKAILNKNVK